MFSSITPRPQEIKAKLPGDEIVRDADVVMDRAFTLPSPPEEVWPWIMQLGKNRAGWYFPHSIEFFISAKNRALHHIEPSLQNLKVGMVIDDWGGKDAYFEVAEIKPPHLLVYKSKRGEMNISWAIVLKAEENNTRIQFRLRLTSVGKKWFMQTGGELLDVATIAGLAAGLKERLREAKK